MLLKHRGFNVRFRLCFDCNFSAGTPNLALLNAAAEANRAAGADLLRSCAKSGPSSSSEAVTADRAACAAILRTCAKAGPTALQYGEAAHARVTKSGLHINTVLCNFLLLMYSKCGNDVAARRIFDSTLNPNSVTWTLMIGALLDAGETDKALQTYCQMRRRGFSGDQFTASNALRSCQGKPKEILLSIHGALIRNGFAKDAFAQGILLEAYGRHGDADSAQQVFDEMPPIRDAVVWTQLLCIRPSLAVLAAMLRDGAELDQAAMASAGRACGNPAETAQTHALAVKLGLNADSVAGSALVAAYARCERMDAAAAQFEGVRDCNVVCWTAMIVGFAHLRNGLFSADALAYFSAMRRAGVVPDEYAATGAIKATADAAALGIGRVLHAEFLKRGLVGGSGGGGSVANALVDMYGKCACVADAVSCFEEIGNPEEDVAAWNALLSAFAHSGMGREAIVAFERMRGMVVPPNEITFVALLSACSHAGLVDEGLRYFERMEEEFGVVAGEEHFGCVVDLLGRAGRLRQADEFVRKKMKKSNKGNASLWETLLAAAKRFDDVELAQMAACEIACLGSGTDLANRFGRPELEAAV